MIASLYNMVGERLGWHRLQLKQATVKKRVTLVIYAGRNGVSALSNDMMIQNKRQASAPMLYAGH
jgi:hypothetical protein